MNIWHVSRTDDYGYDEYSDFVCVAPTEQDARETWPGTAFPRKWTGKHWAWLNDVEDRSWQNPNELTVVLLGEAIDPTPRVICASFHAG